MGERHYTTSTSGAAENSCVVQSRVTDLSPREVGDITFAFHNGEEWKGAERRRRGYINLCDILRHACYQNEPACVQMMPAREKDLLCFSCEWNYSISELV